jgi:hypothetical protein
MKQKHSVNALFFCALIFLSTLFFLSTEVAYAQNNDQIEKTWNKLNRKIESGDTYNSREIMDFALEAADTHPNYSGYALNLLWKMQDHDKDSKTFGNFKWYSTKLAPQDLQLLRQMTAEAIQGIENHKVKVGYTNIYLMKCWNLIAAGELLQQKQIAEDGYANFTNWLSFTKENGISEYLSPTYNGTDLDSLALIRKYAQQDNAKQRAQAALEFLWTQLAANWFMPDQRLGGAHSRDYDYLTGHGYLDEHLGQAGWITDMKPNEQSNATAAQSWLPPETLRNKFTLPRFVFQRFGTDPWQYCTQYIDNTFSIGVAGSSSGAEDKVLTANFAGGPKQVMLNYVMDGRDDPYGQKKQKLKDGHKKAHHISPFVISGQRGANVAFMCSYLPNKKENPNCLFSHLDFPSESEVWNGEEKLSENNQSEIKLQPDLPVFIKVNNAVATIFLLRATTDSGGEAQWFYVSDGEKYKAARITANHATGEPQGPAMYAIFLHLEELENPSAFPTLRKRMFQQRPNIKVNESIWEISTPKALGALKVVGDLLNGKRIQFGPTESAIFTVNSDPVKVHLNLLE